MHEVGSRFLKPAVCAVLALLASACVGDEPEDSNLVDISAIESDDWVDVEQQVRWWDDGVLCLDYTFEGCEPHGRSLMYMTFLYFRENADLARGIQIMDSQYGTEWRAYVSLVYALPTGRYESRTHDRVVLQRRDIEYLYDSGGNLAGVHGWISSEITCRTIVGPGVNQQILFRELHLGEVGKAHRIELYPKWVMCSSIPVR